jgi:hypothetical protein
MWLHSKRQREQIDTITLLRIRAEEAEQAVSVAMRNVDRAIEEAQTARRVLAELEVELERAELNHLSDSKETITEGGHANVE